MEITNIEKTTSYAKEGIRVNEHVTEKVGHKPKCPILPHERKGMITLQFDDKDWIVFNEVFGDQDTATAAVEIVRGAPPEIQILVAQVLKMIEKEVA